MSDNVLATKDLPPEVKEQIVRQVQESLAEECRQKVETAVNTVLQLLYRQGVLPEVITVDVHDLDNMDIIQRGKDSPTH